MQKNEKTKHTPGPWYYSEEKQNTFGEVIIRRIYHKRNGYNVEICLNSVVADKIQAEEREANARLIAAAPDLLAASEMRAEAIDQRIAGNIGKSDELFVRADIAMYAALAKAKGGEK